MPTCLGFLEEQFLTVRINDQEEGLVVGKGIIPLRQAVQSVGQWHDFATRLSVFDETRGQVRLDSPACRVLVSRVLFID